MKIHIKTLGCKMNWLDSARIGAALETSGHRLVESAEEADSVIVNSCTVTAQADSKTRQASRVALRAGKQVAVGGCAVRANPVQWRAQLPNAPAFTDERALLRHFGVQMDALPVPVTSRTRLPVAIQTGCDDLCAFCITRIARGRHVSHPADRLVAHVRQACELGIKEVVLTGINLAAWGSSDTRWPREARLHDLLERLLRETDIPRIRLSSLGPQYLHPGFFDLFADPRICDYLHLSVQSGSPRVLSAMQRGHGVAEIYAIVEQTRKIRPDVALCADIIVGFPGEAEQDFEATFDLARDIGFAKLHVFPFSPRAGTPAATLTEAIDAAEKKRRAAALRAAAASSRAEFLRSQLGKTRSVLVETAHTGLTGNYIRMRAPDALEGEIREIRLSRETIAEKLDPTQPATEPVPRRLELADGITRIIAGEANLGDRARLPKPQPFPHGPQHLGEDRRGLRSPGPGEPDPKRDST